MDGFRCSQKPNTRCVQVLANKQSQNPDALEKNGKIYGYENLWFELNITESSTDNILFRHCIPFFYFGMPAFFSKGIAFLPSYR